VIIIFILARWLLGIFNKDYADNAATLLRILVIAMVPNAINTVYLSIKKVEKNIKIIYLVSAALAVMDIGLTYVLVPHMGINGAGIAWLASQIIVAICILFSFLFRHKSKGSTAPNGNIG
jgi:O-antigen/teichoic acid export membrane protein